MTTAVILAGGKGMRMGTSATSVPKPLTPIGGEAIIVHLMRFLASQSITGFTVALGHRAAEIQRFFSDNLVPWPLKLVDTGPDTGSAARLAQAMAGHGPDPIVMTYCDGLYDVDVNALLARHHQHKRMVTMTTVQPRCRFGIVNIEGEAVTAMHEKPVLEGTWINAGVFAIDRGIINYISGPKNSLEADVLPNLAQLGEVTANRHHGFWQCMDTPADAARLNELWQSGHAPWRGPE